MDRTIFILTEAGGRIGMGHYTRCKAIAEMLKANTLHVSMLVNVKGDLSLNEDYMIVADWLDEKKFKDLCTNPKNAIAIVDSYLAEASYFCVLKKFFQKIIVIDDYNRINYLCSDLIINPGIYGDKLDYSNQTATVAGGKDFIILRDAFLKYKDKIIVREQVSCLGITLGGTDFRNLLPVLCRHFFANTHFDKVRVFCGSEQKKTELQKEFPTSKFAFYGFLNADAFAQEILKCDIVISASGQTLNELVFLGVPAVALCLDIDQLYNTKGFVAYGYLSKLMLWDDKNLITTLDEIIHDYRAFRKRLEIHETGKNLITNKGVENIIKLICSEI